MSSLKTRITARELTIGSWLSFSDSAVCEIMAQAGFDWLVIDMEHTSGEFFLQTHSTTPLVRPETIDRAIETFFSQSIHDSLFSVTPVTSRMYWHDGRGINHDPARLIRTQDLYPIYEENSAIYIFSRTGFLKHKSRLGKRPMMFIMDRFEAVDVDYEFDFVVAEALMAKNIEAGS